MKVFLTGATGYVGSAVLDALLRGGHQVTALVRDPDKAEQVSRRGVCPVLGDLRSPATYTSQAETCDGAIHAALDRSKNGAKMKRREIQGVSCSAIRRMKSPNGSVRALRSRSIIEGEENPRRQCS